MSAKNNTITEKIDQLDALIAWFDSDDFTIEQALEKYQQAQDLAGQIRGQLDEFKNQITVFERKFSEV